MLVWNLKTGNLVRHVDTAHSAVIRGIKVSCFLPLLFLLFKVLQWTDSGMLISVGADAKVMVWQMHGGAAGDEPDPLSPELTLRK